MDDFPIDTSMYKGFPIAMLNNQRVVQVCFDRHIMINHGMEWDLQSSMRLHITSYSGWLRHSASPSGWLKQLFIMGYPLDPSGNLT